VSFSAADTTPALVIVRARDARRSCDSDGELRAILKRGNIDHFQRQIIRNLIGKNAALTSIL
jgi:hypothetical protein